MSWQAEPRIRERSEKWQKEEGNVKKGGGVANFCCLSTSGQVQAGSAGNDNEPIAMRILLSLLRCRRRALVESALPTLLQLLWPKHACNFWPISNLASSVCQRPDRSTLIPLFRLSVSALLLQTWALDVVSSPRLSSSSIFLIQTYFVLCVFILIYYLLSFILYLLTVLSNIIFYSLSLIYYL